MNKNNLKLLLNDYAKFNKKINEQKLNFLKTKKNKQKTLKELIFCLLTPQSKAKNCWLATEEIFKNNFKNIPKILSKKVRFYNNKTNYILNVVKKFDLIYKIINLNLDPKILREILVKEIKGLGYKEASHFLRNIGYCFELAILDRHVLKNLKDLGVIKNIPKNLNKKIYLDIEKKLLNFSNKIGIDMVDLDLTFWARQTGFVFK